MSLKIFVADDSVTIQRMIRLAFNEEDTVIETVSDGDSAFESLKRFMPDIVLADVCIPGCTGYEICARVKEDAELRQIPVVLLVGAFEPFDALEASRVRCDGHLTKPFDTSELLQTVFRLTGAEISSATRPRSETSTPRFESLQATGRVSQAALDSFLGENAVLGIFDPSTRLPADGGAAVAAASPVLSEEMFQRIVDGVVRKMSPEVIREVAWEVVPELSERIIRNTIKEHE